MVIYVKVVVFSILFILFFLLFWMNFFDIIICFVCEFVLNLIGSVISWKKIVVENRMMLSLIKFRLLRSMFFKKSIGVILDVKFMIGKILCFSISVLYDF